MIRVFVTPESGGVVLHVMERRRCKWKRISVKFERYYSRKRVVAIFRKVAQLVELGFP